MCDGEPDAPTKIEITPAMIREGLRALYRSGRLSFEAPGSDELLMRDILQLALRARASADEPSSAKN